MRTMPRLGSPAYRRCPVLLHVLASVASAGSCITAAGHAMRQHTCGAEVVVGSVFTLSSRGAAYMVGGANRCVAHRVLLGCATVTLDLGS